MRLHRWTRWIPLAAALVTPLTARAQGFGLNEIGSCAIARGFAVTSTPCRDASVIYWNPGAATILPGVSLYLGGAQIAVNGDFTQDTTGRLFEGDVPDAYPPHAFVNWTGRGMGKPLSLGLGFYVPYGLTSQWKQDFPGRFQAQKASLATFYVQPNVAVEVAPGWSIGGGPVYGHSNVELRQSLDLADQVATGTVTFGQLGFARGTEFARAQIKGDASAWGFNVGLHGKIGQTISIGARYLSKLTFNYEGANATFTPVPTGLTLTNQNPLSTPAAPVPAGTPVDVILASQFTGSGKLTSQTASTTIVHPWQAQFGIGFTGLANTTLSFDVTRIGWSAFDQLPLNFEGNAKSSSRVILEEFEDDWSYRVGAEYMLGEMGSLSGIALRGGFSYTQTPAPDVTVTPLLPDQDRRNFALGVGIPLAASITLDAGYLRVETPGRRGRIVERTDQQATAASLNSGFYRLDANILTLSLKASF